MTTPLTLWRHARVATMAPGAPWGWIDDGALLVDGSRLRVIATVPAARIAAMPAPDICSRWSHESAP